MTSSEAMELLYVKVRVYYDTPYPFWGKLFDAMDHALNAQSSIGRTARFQSVQAFSAHPEYGQRIRTLCERRLRQ